MKTGWNKKRERRQQQSGKPVAVTFYVARPARDGGAAATASANDLRSHRHESSKRKATDGGSYNRRAELLEYSRQLRALARQGTAFTAAAQPAPPPRPRGRDTPTVSAGVVPDAGTPRAENRLSFVGRRHERARSQQQQIKQRCFGSGAWSWKSRVLVLVFPFHNGSHSKSKRPRWTHDDGRERNKNCGQKGRPVGKQTVSRTGRDHRGLGIKLMSIFQRRS